CCPGVTLPVRRCSRAAAEFRFDHLCKLLRNMAYSFNLACARMKGHRSRRANRAPGRRRAGGGRAWREGPHRPLISPSRPAIPRHPATSAANSDVAVLEQAVGGEVVAVVKQRRVLVNADAELIRALRTVHDVHHEGVSLLAVDPGRAAEGGVPAVAIDAEPGDRGAFQPDAVLLVAVL